MSVHSKKNEHFLREILENTPLHTNILIVLFAREKSRWDKKYQETVSRFENIAQERNLSFECAEDNIIVFRDQIEKSDIIFIHGGDTQMLQNKFEKIPDLEMLFENKIIA